LPSASYPEAQVDNNPYEDGHAENKKSDAHSELEAEVQRTKTEDRPLILYAYAESDFARENLQFFVDHAIHSAADFVFILNGETDVDETIIFKDNESDSVPKKERTNVWISKRSNSCFDLGAHAEVLNGALGGVGWKNFNGSMSSPNETIEGKRPLRERYKRFILMNASIRGPFVPLWSNSCWSDAYLNKLSDKIKVTLRPTSSHHTKSIVLNITIIQLVGMSYNCHTNRGHVQSMIWATDRRGLEVILQPTGIGECFSTLQSAIDGEVRTTQLLRDNGYEVDVFLSVYHSKDKETKPKTPAKSNWKPQTSESRNFSGITEHEAEGAGYRSTMHGHTRGDTVPGDFWKTCTDQDYLVPQGYFGSFVHPYETLFMKSHRNIEDNVLQRLTEWHNGWGYSSYDVCF
jgi:hypothetical protein